MKVYIDGENLRHRLVTVLLRQGLIHDRDDIFQLNVRLLIETALGETPEEISYYTTRIRQPKFDIPENLRAKITAIQESHRRWIADLTNQGVRVVKAGNLKVHETKTCYNCGKRTMLLHEKGVDVRLATDIVVASIQDKARHLVILSSDADMIPALELVRRNGTKVTYLCFEDERNEAVALAADETKNYSSKNITDAYIRSRQQHGHSQKLY